MTLHANPLDISVFDAKTAIVTLPHSKQLQYIKVFPHLTAGQILQLKKKCWGVHVTGNKIFTTCHNNPGEGEVRILDLDGNLLKQLGINKNGTFLFTSPTYITVSPSGKIFVSDRDENTVTCMKMDNHVIYVYRDKEMEWPRRSYCDSGDNILVCGQSSNNVHVITAEGKKRCLLISAKDGLKGPMCISYRESDEALIVACDTLDHVFLLTFGN